jgi:DNA-binding PadR family transcriptional regulator
MARPQRMSRPTRLLLLELLAAPRTWRHGYDISQATALKSGTLYPLLMRLSDLGLLESHWEEPAQEGRPPRHLYRLTPAGVALAKTVRSEQSAAGHALLPRLA